MPTVQRVWNKQPQQFQRPAPNSSFQVFNSALETDVTLGISGGILSSIGLSVQGRAYFVDKSLGFRWNFVESGVGDKIRLNNKFTFIVTAVHRAATASRNICVLGALAVAGPRIYGTTVVVSGLGLSGTAISLPVITNNTVQTTVVSYDGATVSVWRNGVFIGSSAVTGSITTTPIALSFGDLPGIAFGDTADIAAAFVSAEVISPEEAIEYSINPWQLFEPKRVYVPFTAGGGGTNTYTFSVSGGATFSGTSPLVRERVQTPSGGIAFAGAPVISHERAIAASGQVTFSGTAPIVSTASYQFDVSGGVTFSGSPDVIKEKILPAAGGVNFGGSARLIFVPAGGTGNNDSDRISVGVSRKVGVS